MYGDFKKLQNAKRKCNTISLVVMSDSKQTDLRLDRQVCQSEMQRIWTKLFELSNCLSSTPLPRPWAIIWRPYWNSMACMNLSTYSSWIQSNIIRNQTECVRALETITADDEWRTVQPSWLPSGGEKTLNDRLVYNHQCGHISKWWGTQSLKTSNRREQ